MTDLASTTVSMPRALREAATPLWQRVRKALLRWWLRQCQSAERKGRYVPYY